MEDLEGFDGDIANVGHIMRHAVTPFEVEAVVGRAPATFAAKTVKGEKRRKLFGEQHSTATLS